MVDDSIFPTAFHLSDMGQAQGTNKTPQSNIIRKERCPGYKTFNNEKPHTNLETKIFSNERDS